MTKEDRTKAINMSFEAMLFAQALMDEAVTDRQRNIAEALYRAHWAMYLVLQDELQKMKRESSE